MDSFYTLVDTIKGLREQMESFSERIDSAIERSNASPNLSVRNFFFKTGEERMPSRLFKGEGMVNVLVIDEMGVVIKLTLKGGGMYIAHSHDDATEVILVTEGLIREVISGTIIKIGERFRVKAGQEHEYEILEDTVILCTFIFID